MLIFIGLYWLNLAASRCESPWSDQDNERVGALCQDVSQIRDELVTALIANSQPLGVVYGESTLEGMATVDDRLSERFSGWFRRAYFAHRPN